MRRYLEQQGLSLAAILVTHHHADHTGGVNELARAFGVPVYGPANSSFGGIDRPLTDGDSVDLFGQTLKVREVPAHTLDHISYFNAGEPSQLFCGDTLFLAGCGRLFEGTAAQMQRAMDYFGTPP